jgi:hypothetical protein
MTRKIGVRVKIQGQIIVEHVTQVGPFSFFIETKAKYAAAMVAGRSVALFADESTLKPVEGTDELTLVKFTGIPRGYQLMVERGRYSVFAAFVKQWPKKRRFMEVKRG